MEWPDGVDPVLISDFESQARIKRYRLLARECLRLKINQVYLGHHQDDQVETIFMRLAQSGRVASSSFHGIPHVGPIPCCDDIADAHDSLDTATLNGHFDRLANGEARLEKPKSDGHDVEPKFETLNGRISMSKPGIELRRPLLPFPKSRVLSTCSANRIPFVSDPTNFDPRLTMRNAVRHLRSNFRLPRALQQDNILRVHRTAKHRAHEIERKVTCLFQHTKIVSFDLRSGLLTVQLPKLLGTSPRDQLEARQPVPMLPHIKDTQAAACFLERLLHFVSPTPSDHVFNVRSEQFVSRMFGGSSNESIAKRQAEQGATTFAVDGVLIESQESTGSNHTVAATTWRLSRQPFRPREMQRLTQHFALRYHPPDKHQMYFWSDWLLWDHRFWIQIGGSDAAQLGTYTIRPLVQIDMKTVRERLRKKSRKALREFEATLEEASTGKIRYTLPVLLNQNGVVAAFPTLDILIPSDSDESMVEWNVRYKSLREKTLAGEYKK